MQNAKQAPGKDYLDSQLIHEEIDTISTQTRRIIQSVMSPLQKFTVLLLKTTKL